MERNTKQGENKMAKQIIVAELERLSAKYTALTTGGHPDMDEMARCASEIESLLVCLATM
jgi:hypothetical protein